MPKNKAILEYFSRLKSTKTLGSSFLFLGNNPQLFGDILKLVNCREAEVFCGTCWDCKQISQKTHPDLFWIEPETLTIKIERVKEAQGFLAMRPFSAYRKILVIDSGRLLGNEAANAFLKTLEEPPKHSFIAITSDSQEGMLPTILSRCRKIFLPSSACSDEFEIGLAIDFLSGKNIPKFKDRQHFSAFLLTLITLFRDSLSGPNNRLIKTSECEIILNRYQPNKAQEVLETLFEVYQAASSANENLSLELIRTRL